MKTRKILFFTIIPLTVIVLILGHFLIDSAYHGYLYISGLFLIVYTIIYMLFGVSRLITYYIYGVLLVPIIILVKQYQLLFLSVFTIIVVLNPLSFLEVWLDKKLPQGQVEMYSFIPTGKYKTFYSYRRAMKEHFHLPQVKKLYTKPTYQYLRTISVIVLFGLLVFLLSFSARDIIIGKGLGFVNIVTVYISFVLTLTIMILYKRGFTSMFRIIKIFVFPIIIFIIAYFDDLNVFIKVGLLVLNSLGMIGVIINELYSYYNRVTYESYAYDDLNNNEKVYANAIYEPFIYNENKEKTYRFTAKINKDMFHKVLNDLLVYFNFNRCILTAYVVKNDNIILYLEFYNEKRVDKVLSKVEQILDTKVVKKEIQDTNYYETKFLHNHEYIITRAQSLAHLLKNLDIGKPVIVAVNMYFKEINNAEEIMRKYNSKVIEQKEKYVSLEVYLKVFNKDFLIETALRGLLLDMLVYGGKFIRVMVYY